MVLFSIVELGTTSTKREDNRHHSTNQSETITGGSKNGYVENAVQRTRTAVATNGRSISGIQMDSPTAPGETDISISQPGQSDQHSHRESPERLKLRAFDTRSNGPGYPQLARTWIPREHGLEKNNIYGQANFCCVTNVWTTRLPSRYVGNQHSRQLNCTSVVEIVNQNGGETRPSAYCPKTSSIRSMHAYC